MVSKATKNAKIRYLTNSAVSCRLSEFVKLVKLGNCAIMSKSSISLGWAGPAGADWGYLHSIERACNLT